MRPLLIALSLACGGFAACTSQQLYSSGQGWQRVECQRLLDVQERSRCMASTNTSFDEYQRQRNAAQPR